jgi:hypothetical protein
VVLFQTDATLAIAGVDQIFGSDHDSRELPNGLATGRRRSTTLLLLSLLRRIAGCHELAVGSLTKECSVSEVLHDGRMRVGDAMCVAIGDTLQSQPKEKRIEEA